MQADLGTGTSHASKGRSFSPTRSTASSSKRAFSSPTKLRSLIEQGAINEESPAYLSAMEKIYEGSWKFDRSQDDVIMKSLNQRELDPDQFRQILSTGMNCKLTNNEFNAIRPLFANKDSIDGGEFLLLFYRLRFEHRALFLTEKVIADKKAYEAHKTEQYQSSLKVNTRKPIALTDFTAEDLASAEHKMKEGAVKYDRLHPGASPLDGFDVESMDAAEFHDTIKAVFHIKLTLPELSAFILTNHNERGLHRVNCSNFLLNFFRNGFIEKSNRLKELWAKRKAVEERKLSERVEREKNLEKKNAMQVSFTYTEEDRQKALVKLRTAAKLYDKTTPGAMSMKAFEVKEMPPHVFKEQLKRIFNLRVTPAEMGALMGVFDVNGDGVITCEEFTKVFINMGFEEREKELKAFRQAQQEFAAQERQAQLEEQAEKDSFNATKVAFTYTDDEWESAMFKLKEAAWRFDRTMPGAPALDAFEQQNMPAHELKDQLKRVFYMKVTPQELGAVVRYFDPDESGRINCAHFLKKFLRLGYEERSERKREYRLYEEKVMKERSHKTQAKLTALQQKQNVVLANSDINFTEKDFQSAFAKIREAAVKYNKQSPGAAGLNAFEALSMPAHIFREQLKLVFNIKATLPELFALVSYFERSHVPGEIDCAKFIITFLQIGYTERNNLIREFRKKNQQPKLSGTIDKTTTKKEDSGSIVNYTFTEQDMDSMLDKLVMVCVYNNNARSNYGSSGSNVNHLMSFQSIYFTPIEVKTVLKSVFNIKCTPRELGAFISYFDIYNKSAAHVQTFMNMLLQVKYEYKLFKGGRAEERKWMNSMIDELKASYKQRIEKQLTSTDIKPWRSGTTIGNFVSGGVFKRRDHSAPSEPLHKLVLRMLVARRTRRLDLSCKFGWQDEEAVEIAADEAASTVSTKNLDLDKDSAENKVGGDGDVVEDTVLTGGSIVGGSSKVGTVATQHLEQYFCAVLRTSQTAQAAVTVVEPTTSSPRDRLDEVKQLPIGHVYVDFRLHTLPSDVMKLTDLCEVWLDNHRLTSLPRKMSELQCLEILSVRNNCLDALPADLCNCASLKRIYASHNRIASLPNIFGKLHKLEELDLSHNALEIFPEVLTALPHLHVLSLSHNAISSLPMTMLQMKCLYVLNMDGLRVSRSPVLAKMPYLEVIGFVNFGSGEKSAKPFVVTPSEEFELVGMIRNRAALKQAEKGGRRKNA